MRYEIGTDFEKYPLLRRFLEADLATLDQGWFKQQILHATYLLPHAYDEALSDDGHYTALEICSFLGSMGHVRYIIEAMRAQNIPPQVTHPFCHGAIADGSTGLAIVLAFSGNNTEVISYFIEQFRHTEMLPSIFSVAVMFNHDASIQALLSSESLQLQEQDKINVLQLALQFSNADIMHYLLQQITIRFTANIVDSLLQYAIQHSTAVNLLALVGIAEVRPHLNIKTLFPLMAITTRELLITILNCNGIDAALIQTENGNLEATADLLDSASACKSWRMVRAILQYPAVREKIAEAYSGTLLVKKLNSFLVPDPKSDSVPRSVLGNKLAPSTSTPLSEIGTNQFR